MVLLCENEMKKEKSRKKNDIFTQTWLVAHGARNQIKQGFNHIIIFKF